MKNNSNATDIEPKALLTAFPDVWKPFLQYRSMALNTLQLVDQLLTEHEISYCLTGGTLLGCVRHGGFIPWDDDLDIVVAAKDKTRFSDACKNLHLFGCKSSTFWGGHKIFPVSGMSIKKRRGGHYPWLWPFLDIFFYREEAEKVVIDTKSKKLIPRHAFLPFKRSLFENISILAPNAPEECLDLLYSPTWKTECVANRWSHRRERRIRNAINTVNRENLEPFYYFQPIVE